MTSDELFLDGDAREYLSRFCEERNNRRSGMVQWDSFLVHAYKSGSNPPAADLYDWLQRRLKDASDIESLIHDYQRVGALFAAWDRILAGRSEPVARRSDDLLVELTESTLSSGVSLGEYVPSEPQSSAQTKHCRLRDDVRNVHPHVLLVGKRDQGKTELLLRMVIHDVMHDRPVVAIDTDGLLCDLVQAWLKEDGSAHANRLVILDPLSPERSVGFNPLAVGSETEFQPAASAIVDAFKANAFDPKSPMEWSRRSENLLLDSAMLLMANRKQLADLPLVLHEVDYRDVLLEKIDRLKAELPEYGALLTNWVHHKRQARSDQWLDWIYPITSRVSPILSNQRLMDIVSGRGPQQLDLAEIVRDKKLLLVRLPYKQFKNAGTLIASLVIYHLERASTAAFANQRRGTRKVALYVDGIADVLDRSSLERFVEHFDRHHVDVTATTRQLLSPRWFSSDADSWGRTLSSFGNVAVFRVDPDDAQVMSRYLPADSSAFFARHGWNIDGQKLAADRLMQLEPRHYVWWRTSGGGATLEIKLAYKEVVESLVK